ncbi:Non-catalytic module family DOC2, partial [Piromyces sp. E2]
GFPCCLNLDGGIVSVDAAGEWNVEGSVWCLYDRPVGSVSAAVSECWAHEQGFPCCQKATEILYTENGKNWSMENGDWCGI